MRRQVERSSVQLNEPLCCVNSLVLDREVGPVSASDTRLRALVATRAPRGTCVNGRLACLSFTLFARTDCSAGRVCLTPAGAVLFWPKKPHAGSVLISLLVFCVCIQG